MAMDPTALASLIVAGSSALGAAIAFQQSRIARLASDAAKTNAADKVEREAFDTARGLWEVSVKDSRVYIEELRQELAGVRRDLRATQTAFEKEKSDRKFLQIRVHELELTVRKLEMILKDLGFSLEESE